MQEVAPGSVQARTCTTLQSKRAASFVSASSYNLHCSPYAHPRWRRLVVYSCHCIAALACKAC
eukprot:6194649-Pleurochrysis_carterae.AAC.2